MRRSAFTLIELLVVIAIIGVLAGLLLPVLSNAKTAADKTTGISNMKQIILAEKLYQDREGAYPPYDGDAFLAFLYFTDDINDLKLFNPKGTTKPSFAKTAAATTALNTIKGVAGFKNATANVAEPNSASTCAMAADSRDDGLTPPYKGARAVGYWDGSARAQGAGTIWVTIGSANGGANGEKDLSVLQTP